MLKDSGIRQHCNLIAIAIEKVDNDMIFNPSFESRIQPGETLIAVGEEYNPLALENDLNPGTQ